MAQTLSTLRSRVKTKLNNLGSSGQVPFQDSEIDSFINQAILHVGYTGEIALIQRDLFKQTDLTPSGGKITKPSDFFKFRYARIDNRRGKRITPEGIDDVLYDELQLAGNKNKYIVDYSGTEYQIYPTNASSVAFHYISTLTALTADADTSPLTDAGDVYAGDWAFAVALEAKGFNPNLAARVFARVQSILTNTPLTGSTVSSGGDGGDNGGGQSQGGDQE